MQNEGEFDKEFGELRKRKFWLLVRRPQTNGNGHVIDFDPVIKVGSRVKARGRWWDVIASNGTYGLKVKGIKPGKCSLEQIAILRRDEIKDVRLHGRDGGFVLLRRTDWLKLKRDKLT